MDYNKILKYAPSIYIDEKEPFLPVKIGCTIFEKPSFSRSFKRKIDFNEEIKFVIEYAIYWDFDIQHMYDLEHIWVYVDKDDNVVECEASFHGKFFRGLKRDKSNIEDNTHVKLFCQPGKHAFSPILELFEMIPNVERCTWEDAGIDGLIVTDVGLGLYVTSDEINFLVKKFIYEKYKFLPSGKYIKYNYPDDIFVSWDCLHSAIPDMIHAKLHEINTKLTFL